MRFIVLLTVCIQITFFSEVTLYSFGQDKINVLKKPVCEVTSCKIVKNTCDNMIWKGHESVKCLR